MYLIDPSNKESFFTWMNEFTKAIYWLIDYEPILQAYASEVSKSLSGKLADKLWHKALIFSVERSIAKKKEDAPKFTKSEELLIEIRDLLKKTA